MNNNEIITKLNVIFREMFDDDTIVVTESTNASDIDDWDSLHHIRLVIAVENAFEIKFTINEISEFKNVGNMVSVILTKI